MKDERESDNDGNYNETTIADIILVLIVLTLIAGGIYFVSVYFNKAHAAGTGNSQSLTIHVPTTQDVNGNPITGVTYNWYQGLKGAAKLKVISQQASITQVFNNVPYGETCWTVTAQTPVNPESKESNEACYTFPYPQAAAPVL